MSFTSDSGLDAALDNGEHTLPKLLQHWARTTPDALALREKDLGIWNRMTWADYHDAARRFALGLLKLGFRRGERLARVALPPGAAIKVVEAPPGPPVMATLLAEIYGPDAATRRAVAERVKATFHAVPYIVDIDDSWGAPRPTLPRKKPCVRSRPARPP